MDEILLNSPEEVTRRFKQINNTEITLQVSSRSLQMYEVAVNFLEQLADEKIFKYDVKEKVRESAEEILINLPIING